MAVSGFVACSEVLWNEISPEGSGTSGTARSFPDADCAGRSGKFGGKAVKRGGIII
jgi:hypothetical protein